MLACPCVGPFSAWFQYSTHVSPCQRICDRRRPRGRLVYGHKRLQFPCGDVIMLLRDCLGLWSIQGVSGTPTQRSFCRARPGSPSTQTDRLVACWTEDLQLVGSVCSYKVQPGPQWCLEGPSGFVLIPGLTQGGHRQSPPALACRRARKRASVLGNGAVTRRWRRQPRG